jgi:tetratricopeptide (TPR) repeat protein
MTMHGESAFRVVSVVALLLLPVAGLAQTPSAQTPSAQTPSAQTPSAQTPSAQTPSAQTPSAQSPPNRRADTDRLLDALKAAPSEEMAAPLESQVRQRWLEAGTPAVTLLMSRGLRDLQSEQNDDAVDVFTDAITLDPNLAEAYHQRAIARYHAGDTPGAIRDIEETLQHEPRDFAALRTLAEISAAREDWKGAYAAWQKLLEIDPKTRDGEDRLKEFKRKAFGEDA